MKLKILILLFKIKNKFVLEKFTETQIVANAFVMFVAGFETVSTAVSFCLYELALNKSIQDKVREEIQLKLSQNNGQIDHALLMDLNYLDIVIDGNLLFLLIYYSIKITDFNIIHTIQFFVSDYLIYVLLTLLFIVENYYLSSCLLFI